ncbi:alpha/beta fold hydrolase [Aurantibacillus circumpalustris]|uniref:alpha/beta fold hydrolase n=1 Tax=Aurantibacillus circumpalustris TaxID=3036359 RepID=UPI00295BFB8C|nr:alpha/beta hydrolase [Aurantibacillus circumpalustris]
MRYTFLFSFFLCQLIGLRSQTKIPFLFRKQEEKTTKHIHKYLSHDTLVETSQANIHIYYSNKPNMPYLLLLHGMGIDAKTNWYKQISNLSKHYNLLVPDLIYFGTSTAKENNYSVEFQVEQIHELIKKLNINPKINVMGFSYGGLTAAVYNEFFNAEVNKLIIIDGPVKFFSGQMADSLAHIVGVPSMSNIIIPQTVSEYKAMEKAVLSKKIPTTKKFKRKLIHYYFTPTLEPRQLEINYLIEHQNRYQFYDYNIDKTPTLLIWGAKDGVVPLTVGEKLHEYFPKTTQLLTFKKGKHDSHFRYSKKVNKAVVNFLKN